MRDIDDRASTISEVFADRMMFEVGRHEHIGPQRRRRTKQRVPGPSAYRNAFYRPVQLPRDPHAVSRRRQSSCNDVGEPGERGRRINVPTRPSPSSRESRPVR